MTNEQLCTLAQAGDMMARDMLLINSQDFIRKIAKGISSQYQDDRVSEDDLVQEGCFGLLEAIPRYKPDKGTIFHTYAGYWVRKFMWEAVNIFAAPVEIGSLNDIVGDEERTELIQFIADPYSETPEQIVIRIETIEDVRMGLRQITARERTYLLYRYGFVDGDEHPVLETAAHFHLTEKRAKKTERAALDNLRSKLPH
ncbi:MAG: sigma-70 family RNA polymerase sigma factor [Oscillibacter sp.]|jgi:RNA polymerase primary sigma factor/RNA polymerase sporulation-specific sigma factor|nr:sigma-70 family RNA polymerase sigma factor [Hungatella sp.]MCI8809540.1 sigma-70 family RNA polymerase sigma factor [Oscillibacter sp.]